MKRKPFNKVRKVIRGKVNRTKSNTEMNIEDFLISCSKGDRDSIIYVGNLVENTLKGPFGAVIKALTAGRIDMELQANKDGKLSSERILGRCEMGSTLWHDLEAFVLERDVLLRPMKEPKEHDGSMAEEPQPESETYHA